MTVNFIPAHPDNGRTFAEVFADTTAQRWEGRRSGESLPTQARKGLEVLAVAVHPRLADIAPALRLGFVLTHEVSTAHIKLTVKAFKDAGLKPALINRRLVCLSAMGFNVKGNYQRVPKALKWWLKPDDQAKLVKQLQAYGDQEFIDYVVWATSTGIRIEETLRLTRADFTRDHEGNVLVTVPGLKTYDAQATLPLPREAVEVFERRLGTSSSDTALFPTPYWKLAERWRRYRRIIGAGGSAGATLKALRRGAARNLHAGKGMPLDLVRHYLRHENIETTMGYLRLTGGYSTTEFARYL